MSTVYTFTNPISNKELEKYQHSYNKSADFARRRDLALESIEYVREVLPLGEPNYSEDYRGASTMDAVLMHNVFNGYVEQCGSHLKKIEKETTIQDRIKLVKEFIAEIKKVVRYSGFEEGGVAFTPERLKLIPAIISQYLQNIFIGELSHDRSSATLAYRAAVAKTFGVGNFMQQCIVAAQYLIEKHGTKDYLYPLSIFIPGIKFVGKPTLLPLNDYCCLSVGADLVKDKSPELADILFCDIARGFEFSYAKLDFPFAVNDRFKKEESCFLGLYTKPILEGEKKVLLDSPKLPVSRQEIMQMVSEIYTAITDQECSLVMNLAVVNSPMGSNEIESSNQTSKGSSDLKPLNSTPLLLSGALSANAEQGVNQGSQNSSVVSQAATLVQSGTDQNTSESVESSTVGPKAP